MKKTNSKYLFLILVLFVIINTAAQVGIGTTSPDTSSMLDVNVDDLAVDAKKGVLIPRMNSTERVDIPTPANGLLVFDTTSNSFWYYKTDAWKELVGEGTLADADGDTKIEVEKVADTDPDGDEINFTTRGTERMKIGNDGEVLMGTDLSDQATTFFEIGTDGTIKLGNKKPSTLTENGYPESDEEDVPSYTRITADGSLSYEGNATRWEDLKVNVSRLTGSGIKAPSKNVVVDAGAGPGLFLYWFDDDTEQELFFTVQMPHGWKEGSDIKPHVHWVADNGSGNVIWALEYTWANVSDTFTTSTFTLENNTPISAYADYKHMLTSLGDMDGSGKKLSSIILCRVFRKAGDGADTFTNDAGLLQIDFHYQIDSDGSNQLLFKE